MFFVTSQVGDITILMGNQISDFLNQPHNRTLSHRDSLLTKAVTRFMCHGRLFALCYWIQSHLWVHKLHHTFPHMFSALFWNCSFSANMLVSHLAHINFTGFMRHLALSLSSDCLFLLLFLNLFKLRIGILLGSRSRLHTRWDLRLCFSRLTLDSSVDIACFSMKGSLINVRS